MRVAGGDCGRGGDAGGAPGHCLFNTAWWLGGLDSFGGHPWSFLHTYGPRSTLWVRAQGASCTPLFFFFWLSLERAVQSRERGRTTTAEQEHSGTSLTRRGREAALAAGDASSFPTSRRRGCSALCRLRPFPPSAAHMCDGVGSPVSDVPYGSFVHTGRRRDDADRLLRGAGPLPPGWPWGRGHASGTPNEEARAPPLD